jgi:P27 family predicted phage terminase small subunit
MGRHPIPTVIKEASGTLRKSRELQKYNLKGSLTEAPFPPSGLTKAEKSRWKDICLELVRLKVFENTDVDLILLLIMEESRYYSCMKEMRKKKSYLAVTKKGVMSNPLNTVAGQAFKAITTLRAILGLSPAARASLKLNVEAKNDDEDHLSDFGL